MGKSSKKKIRSDAGDKVSIGAPLGDQIEAGRVTKKKQRSNEKQINVADHDEFVSGALSRKILEKARQQQDEILQEDKQEQDDNIGSDGETTFKKPKNYQLASSSRSKNASETTEDDDDDDSLLPDGQDNEFYEMEEIDEEEEKALEKFMSKEAGKTRTLADIIQQKIAEKQSEMATQMTDVSVQVRQLHPSLTEMYRGVGRVLSTYRSGKLPKAFKIVPKLVNWEQILQITEPDNWSAAAMYMATRIFVSNLNAKMCQRYFNLILLPRIRDDIQEYKKLNFHLYQALKKALFKPAAFFKGILLPLCESGTCTLREATIVGSALTKCTIPMLHSAAAMLKLAEMDYSGANSLFLRILIDKKYTLPYRVIDALVYHFLRFRTDKREMPVLWHQSLLSLAQRYKADLSSEQRESLMELLRIHSHYMITAEIRRELNQSESRAPEDGSTMDMDYDD